MPDKLVIVESPAKARTIEKYLGKGYKVLASVGHVRDLPESSDSVDVERDFAPHYQIIPGKEQVIAQLRSSALKSEAVYMATDPDREGEAIAWHIVESIDVPAKIPVHRVTFTEITPNAVRQAIANPRDIDMSLVDAQQALLRRYQLPTQVPAQLTVSALLEVMHRDKKVEAGQLRWALPRAIGSAEIVRGVPIATVQTVLESLVHHEAV